MARVVLEHLTKTFPVSHGEPVRAVQDVSLEVEEQELLVLVGPSGCGKTTTLRLIAGLEEPDSGFIRLDGQVVNQVPPGKREVAMVFQNHALYPHLTAFDNLALGLKIRHGAKGEIAQRVQETAAILGLADCLDRKPAELSGGQRQRVALGRAMVRHPRVFLFDEPLSNLDGPMRLQMRAELSKLHRRLGATMLYVTHDQAEAMMLGGRIAVMKDGMIQQVATPRELYQKPGNLFVAGFIGLPPINLFRGQLVRTGSTLVFQVPAGNGGNAPGSLSFRLDGEAASRLEKHVGRQMVLGMRPESIIPQFHLNPALLGQTLQAIVELVELAGPETLLHLSIGTHAFIVRAESSCAVKADERVPVVFNLRAAHFFDPETEQAL